MANIDLKLSSKEDKVTHRSEILIRFYQGQKIDYRVKSGLLVEPRHFRYFVNRNASKKQGVVIPDKVLSVTKEEAKSKGYAIATRGEVVITDRLITPEVKFDKEQARLLGELQTTIIDAFVAADKSNLSEDWLDKIVYRFHHPLGAGKVKRQRGKKRVSIYDLAEEYLDKKRFSYDHTKAFRVLVRDLARYEAFKKKVLQERFAWNIDKMTRKDIEDFGTPIYITKEERNIVAEADMPTMFEKLEDEDKKACSKLPLKTLETLRDIFVFQCLVGCRVGDLMRLTSQNITQGILEYVPSKTADENAPVKPRIPLNPCALELVKKYEGVDKNGRLFPFISPQKYNEAIKATLLICGITRIVQVRNSTTGENEMKRICDVASSHMARRTFVGAAYKAVRDPNIVAR